MAVLGFLKPKAQPLDENNVLRRLLKDRDTRWYAGDLLKLNLIIVIRSSLKIQATVDMPVLPAHHVDE